jgi:alkylation response protein AidB-like acyl-CoA dehydrogenase
MTFAVTDPDVASDAGNIEAKAVRDRDKYVLT